VEIDYEFDRGIFDVVGHRERYHLPNE